jgi:hypothetical protein
LIVSLTYRQLPQLREALSDRCSWNCPPSFEDEGPKPANETPAGVRPTGGSQ